MASGVSGPGDPVTSSVVPIDVEMHAMAGDTRDPAAHVARDDSIPTASVDCERGISAYNAVKNSTRSHHLYLQAADIDNFNYHSAFKRWIEGKERRGLTAFAKP